MTDRVKKIGSQQPLRALLAVAGRSHAPATTAVAIDRIAADAIASMIRVNHAGEFGAMRIYDGQISVLGASASGGALFQMRAQEREHLGRFAEAMADRTVRPTALLPIWHFAGFALGALTAMMGEAAAMACSQNSYLFI